ncbi:hypothetical protein BDV97DRAFT_294405 [Delphinella strobiligena]|nr:hypothetical protein BDV97DRAFT_294405 [Delphinella strobiligena]
MKFSTSLVLTAAAVIAPVFAVPTLPACASGCAFSSANSTSCDSLTDIACICKDTVYQTAFSTCIVSSCDTADQSEAATYGAALCAQAGVTLPGVSNSTSAASTTSSAMMSSSSAASSTVASTSMAVAVNSTTSSSVPVYTGAATLLHPEMAGVAAIVGLLVLQTRVCLVYVWLLLQRSLICSVSISVM